MVACLGVSEVGAGSDVASKLSLVVLQVFVYVKCELPFIFSVLFELLFFLS